uniref:Pheromone binding protein 3 n=1 Tax=Cnaphalocrocis medinalis TaxID=437488 RepID=M4XYA9_CNAME|nr:pheromone binding protein 3 [Cnaphalocrocis medinalis]
MLRVSAVILLASFALSLGRSLAASTASSSQDKSAKPTDEEDSKDVKASADSQDDKTASEEAASGEVTELMTAMSECNETFRIEMGYIHTLHETGSFPDETDRTPKCFVRCVLEKTGIASEDGQYSPEQVALVFPGERGGRVMDDIPELAKPCTDRKETCKCERAYKFINCVIEAEIKEYESS